MTESRLIALGVIGSDGAVLGRVGLTGSELLREKLADANTPGYEPEFDPDEADAAGAFEETALTEEEAREGACDLLDLVEFLEQASP